MLTTNKLRVLAGSAILAGAAALILAPAGGAARGATCNGEQADHVMLKPGEYIGTPASEVIVGSNGADVIRGGAGDDIICGRVGDDSLSGGGDDDELEGDDGDDTLRGKLGNDDLDGGFDNNNRKHGFEENDFCLGGKPKPDTQSNADTATNDCEHVVSALTNGDE